MSNLKHTPGPWKIQRDDRGLFQQIGPLFLGVIYADDAWLDIEEPDAQLIAAAPEMLEALVELYKMFGGTDKLKFVETIIEKATGLPIEEVLR